MSEQLLHLSGKKICFLIFLAMYGINAFAQSTSYCPNADFELNNFTNWNGYTGNCCPVSVPTPGIVAGRHTIITAPGIDPETCGGLQILPSFVGGKVCRLGNSNTGSQAERLVYPLAVDSNNALFVYRYAVVLEDPNHPKGEQPNFRIRVLNQAGVVIDTVCGQYFVEAGAGIPGFKSCGSNRWKDWTTVGIDLSGYIGQNVQIEFTTSDCGYGAHFGYAYLDCYCMAMKIQVQYCIGANQVMLVAPPGFNSYLWGNNATTQIITIPAPSSSGQVMTCQVTTVTGCNLTLKCSLEPTTVKAAIAYNASICGNQIQFFDSTTVINGPIVKWKWNFGDGSVVDTTQNPSHTYASQGTYTVTLSAFTSIGCSDTIAIQVKVSNAPVALFTANSPCEGSPVVFQDHSVPGTGTLTNWSWDFGDTTTSLSQNPSHIYTSSGTFNVTLVITASTGCVDTVKQTVVVNPQPKADFAFASVFCGNQFQFSDSSVITNGQVINWQWTFGDNSPTDTTINPAHTYSAAGTYNVQLIITAAGGCSDQISKTVTVFNVPNASFTANSPCEGNAVVFQDHSVPGTGNLATWNWDFGDMTTGSTQNPSHIYTGSGTFNVTLIITASTGCMDTITQAVVVNPQPKANFISAAGLCSNQFQFTDSSVITNGQITNWQWTFGDNSPSDTMVSPSHSYSTGGIYNVHLVITAAGGCSDQISKPVVVLNLPNASFNTNSPCEGDPVNFKDNSTPGSGNVATWSWDFGDLTIGNTQHPQHIYPKAGNYLVQLIIVTNNGCVDTISRMVTVNPNPVANFVASDTAACIPLCTNLADLTKISGGNIAQYEWQLGDGNISNSQNPYHCYTKPGFYSLSLKTTSDRGCVASMTRLNYLQVYEPALADFTLTPTSTDIYHTQADFTNLSANATIWTWDFGDASPYSFKFQTDHEFPSKSGIYTITLYVQSPNGCLDTAQRQIEIRDVFSFFVPNAFSPNNGDGSNDYFSGYGVGIKEYNMIIYNRWGELVFTTDDINHKWDGTVGNSGARYVQQEVYVWKVNLTDVFDEPHSYVGHVTVVR